VTIEEAQRNVADRLSERKSRSPGPGRAPISDPSRPPSFRRPSVVNLPDPPRTLSWWSTTSIVADNLWGSTPTEVTALAWDLAEAAAERFQERHDEHDDPDQGGEA
jgi:hypothetical protein